MSEWYHADPLLFRVEVVKWERAPSGKMVSRLEEGQVGFWFKVFDDVPTCGDGLSALLLQVKHAEVALQLSVQL